MTRNELLEKLRTYNVPASLFSLNEALKPHAYILFESDGVWEGCYFDEKGNEHDRIIYPSEEIAYDYRWLNPERRDALPNSLAGFYSNGRNVLL